MDQICQNKKCKRKIKEKKEEHSPNRDPLCLISLQFILFPKLCCKVFTLFFPFTLFLFLSIQYSSFLILFSLCILYICICKYIYEDCIYLFMKHRERGRDTSRGRSRLLTGSPMWDLIPGPWDHSLSWRQTPNHWATQASLAAYFNPRGTSSIFLFERTST